MNFHNFMLNRPTLLLYRDLIRLINHVMEDKKRMTVLSLVRKEFEKNKKLKDDEEILKLKKNAAKAMTDLYLMHVKNSIPKDKQPDPFEKKI